jgi:predicted nucleotidyltransferase
MRTLPIEIPEASIREFCARNHIQRLALFGSVVRDDFRAESDVDVLIEFEPGHCVGLTTFVGLEIALSKLLGRHVDLNTPASLSPYFREQVLAEAENVYVEEFQHENQGQSV